MASPSSQRAAEEEFPLEEIVFCCAICQATVSEVYETRESNKGFHSDCTDQDGVVTRMWIAECSHVTCSKHLKGGAPFHPKDIEPRAPCPRCIHASGDDRPKALYAIRGLGEGQCDAAIPAEWRRCPPVKLDSSTPGMEALRFQYMALAHCARAMKVHCKHALDKQRSLETAHAKEHKQRRQLQTDVLDLKAQSERLRAAQSKLEMWEIRKPKIFHYLGLFGEMMREIHANRDVLRELGHQVSERNYGFESDEVSQAEEAILQGQQKARSTGKKVSSATTAVDPTALVSSSSRKRKREASLHDHCVPTVPQMQKQRGSSRDVMPPPLPRARLVQHAEAPLKPVSEPSLCPPAWQAYNGGRFHNARLPFRPTPSRQQQSQGSQQRYRAYEYDEMVNCQPRQDHRTDEAYYDLPYQQPSNPLPNNPIEMQYYHATEPTPHSIALRAPQDRHQVLTQDEAHGMLLQQNHARTQHRVAPESFTVQQLDRRPWANEQGGVRATIEGQGRVELRDAVDSPFFKHGQTNPSTDNKRPPTRCSYMRPSESSYPAEAQRTKPGLPFFPTPAEYLKASQQPRFLPQTPRNSQGLFQRLERASPAKTTYAPSRPQTNTLRSRISLPPSNGRKEMSSHGSQDGALSRIQGVRGLAFHQSQNPGYVSVPAFHTPRHLFSAAGSRRSVRR